MKKRIEFLSPQTSPKHLFVSAVYVEGEDRYFNDDNYLMSGEECYAVLPNFDLNSGRAVRALIPHKIYLEIKQSFENGKMVLLNGMDTAVKSDEETYQPAQDLLYLETVV